LLVACGGNSACPTVEQLGSGAEEKVIVERCRADGWSKEVTDCLKAAKSQDATEPCLRKLDKPQRAKLKAAFEPLRAEYEKIDHAGAVAHLAGDIAALHLDTLVARDAACAVYKDALNAARDALAA